MNTSVGHDSRSSFIPKVLSSKGRNQHAVIPRSLQIALASLLIGMGLTSALALGVAGYARREAIARQNQAAIAQTQSEASERARHWQAITLQRHHQIQALAQLSVLSHEKIRSSLAIGEQRQALTQYSAGYEGYDSITFTDLQGNVVIPIQGSSGGSNVSRAVVEQAMAQGSLITNAPGPDGAALQLVAPVMDAATGQAIGTIEAMVSAQTLQTELEALSHHADDRAGKAAGETGADRAIAFQLPSELALVMALSLPLAVTLLTGLILFWDHHIHQALALPPQKLKHWAGSRADR